MTQIGQEIDVVRGSGANIQHAQPLVRLETSEKVVAERGVAVWTRWAEIRHRAAYEAPIAAR